MPHRITRERMIEAIRELPEDASVDDAIERLVFLAKIEEGLAQLDRGEGIPHDEVTGDGRPQWRSQRYFEGRAISPHPACDRGDAG
jgi:predicted transcriptional regulator